MFYVCFLPSSLLALNYYKSVKLDNRWTVPKTSIFFYFAIPLLEVNSSPGFTIDQLYSELQNTCCSHEQKSWKTAIKIYPEIRQTFLQLWVLSINILKLFLNIPIYLNFFRNNLKICIKCEIPVLKLHGSTCKLAKNYQLFARQWKWFVSLQISLSNKQ